MRRSPLGCGGHSVQTVIASLNPILKGWYGYFQHAHRFTFSSIDGFVRGTAIAVPYPYPT
ncbi:MAG: group II intron maturase-specific domain-containing protein [Gammaproteobacteria bacterium]